MKFPDESAQAVLHRYLPADDRPMDYLQEIRQTSLRVSKYIPEMANVKGFTNDAPAITVENLLTMSAGFPEDNPWGDRQLANTDEELLALIRQGI